MKKANGKKRIIKKCFYNSYTDIDTKGYKLKDISTNYLKLHIATL